MPDFSGVDKTFVKLETRTVDPMAVQYKVSKGAKFASALGRALGPVTAAAGFFFPPLFAASAAFYGIGKLGAQSVARQQQQIAAQRSLQAQQGPREIQFIGYQGGGGVQPASAGTIGGIPQDQVMDVFTLRQQTETDMIHAVGHR